MHKIAATPLIDEHRADRLTGVSRVAGVRLDQAANFGVDRRLATQQVANGRHHATQSQCIEIDLWFPVEERRGPPGLFYVQFSPVLLDHFNLP